MKEKTCRRCGLVGAPCYFGTGPGSDLCHGCHMDQPRIEHTEAGKQVVISDAPKRIVPDTPLKPKRSQTEKPTLLEMYQEEIKQGKLF